MRGGKDRGTQPAVGDASIQRHEAVVRHRLRIAKGHEVLRVHVGVSGIRLDPGCEPLPGLNRDQPRPIAIAVPGLQHRAEGGAHLVRGRDGKGTARARRSDRSVDRPPAFACERSGRPGEISVHDVRLAIAVLVEPVHRRDDSPRQLAIDSHGSLEGLGQLEAGIEIGDRGGTRRTRRETGGGLGGWIRIKGRRRRADAVERDGIVAGLGEREREPAVGRPAGKRAPGSAPGGRQPSRLPIEPQAGAPERRGLDEGAGVDGERARQQRVIGGGRIAEVRDVHSHAAGEHEAGQKRPAVLQVEPV